MADTQEPNDQTARHEAQELLDQCFRLADRALVIAQEVEAEVAERHVTAPPRLYSSGKASLRRARESVDAKQWLDARSEFNTILNIASRGLGESAASELESSRRYLAAIDELAVATNAFFNLGAFRALDS